MARTARTAFLSTDGLLQAVAKRCVKEDIAIETDTIEKVIDATFGVLFDRIISDKREVGDQFDCRLFRLVIKGRKERLCRNPRKGSSVAKGATRTVSFKPSRELVAALDDKYRKQPSKALRALEAEKNQDSSTDEVKESSTVPEKKLLKKKKAKINSNDE
jgi:nucleoid DNA-binding protein